MIIDGNRESQEITENLRQFITEKGISPKLSIIRIGDDDASGIYIHYKTLRAKDIGIEAEVIDFPGNVSEKEVLAKIDSLNKQKKVNGIIVQMPVPAHISKESIITAIYPEKDVDGFNPINFGRLALGLPGLYSCTAMGVKYLIKKVENTIAGKNVVIIGRSFIVGKPTAMLLLNENASVTVLHSYSESLEEHTKKADILVSCVGKPGLVKADMVKENATVIDVGIARMKTGKIVGDTDFEDVKNKVKAITPPVGGVGPMTIAMLLYNTTKAYCMQKGMNMEALQ